MELSNPYFKPVAFEALHTTFQNQQFDAIVSQLCRLELCIAAQT